MVPKLALLCDVTTFNHELVVQLPQILRTDFLINLHLDSYIKQHVNLTYISEQNNPKYFHSSEF
jgi:hypothetical protein